MEEPRPDASNARRQRPATREIGVFRALACVLNTRGCPQVFCTGAPIIHTLCAGGCINVPGRQVNAVCWGRYPTACAMCVKTKLEFIGELADKISPALLRVDKLGCASSRQAIPWGWVYLYTRSDWFGGGVRRTPGLICPFQVTVSPLLAAYTYLLRGLKCPGYIYTPFALLTAPPRPPVLMAVDRA
jgi:hypothetical protein